MQKFLTIVEIASELRGKLKEAFPGYKFSVTVSKYSGGRTLHVHLMSGATTPFQCNPYEKDLMIGEINEKTFSSPGDKSYANHLARMKHEEITGVFPHESAAGFWNNGNFLTSEAWDMLQRVSKLAQTHNWDNSDTQVDYFDVNYYIHMGIGKWDKPYVITTNGGI